MKCKHKSGWIAKVVIHYEKRKAKILSSSNYKNYQLVEMICNNKSCDARRIVRIRLTAKGHGGVGEIIEEEQGVIDNDQRRQTIK